AREFCQLAQALRDSGYGGHVIAGGHFASLNSRRLLQDFSIFDSVGLGEGEELVVALAENLEHLDKITGLAYRLPDGSVKVNPSKGNPDDLDALPFPKRTTFHSYWDKPIASILSSRGCWRDCAFCSINAWYKQGGGKKFRVRSIENIVAEMKELYFQHGIRIFNFQDDNFFLLRPEKALRRFEALRHGLRREGVEGIAIAVKARPDSITEESVRVLDDLGLFRVFLGVENASEHGLNCLNRHCRIEDILDALRILNEFDVHIAYNLLMFELDTTMDDILINLRFIERHMENPFNFCRAEAYAGTGLEAKLRAQGRLLGDYFGFDYRLKDPRAEVFHQIANYAFFDRNFSDNGLHYFNMQVDFYFQLLRRFYPERLTQTLRAAVRNFIKQTNLDTFQCLSRIYDFVMAVNPPDQVAVQGFSREMRERVDQRSEQLRLEGEKILEWQNDLYRGRGRGARADASSFAAADLPFPRGGRIPYTGLEALESAPSPDWTRELDPLGFGAGPIPYDEFQRRMRQESTKEGTGTTDD
ncbi:MAG: B12-binding domain-containing radical SAM protein, partial [Candidatus Hydrogenedentota bacterium]